MTKLFTNEDKLPTQRAHEAVHNLVSLCRACAGPDDDGAQVAIAEGDWLLGQLVTQVEREQETVILIAQHMFHQMYPTTLLTDATEEQEAMFIGFGREAFRFASTVAR